MNVVMIYLKLFMSIYAITIMYLFFIIYHLYHAYTNYIFRYERKKKICFFLSVLALIRRVPQCVAKNKRKIHFFPPLLSREE